MLRTLSSLFKALQYYNKQTRLFFFSYNIQQIRENAIHSPLFSAPYPHSITSGYQIGSSEFISLKNNSEIDLFRS